MHDFKLIFFSTGTIGGGNVGDKRALWPNMAPMQGGGHL